MLCMEHLGLIQTTSKSNEMCQQILILTSLLQGGPLPVIDGVITPINGLINR